MKTEITKICKEHGNLALEDIRVYVRNRRGRLERQIACKLCHRLSSSTARNANREKANEWARQDRKNNPEKYREQAKRYKKKSWQKISVGESLRKLGITNEEYKKIVDLQNNKCAICFKEETRKSRNGGICRLCIDHDHISGKVRKLLCHDCNTGIGKFKDNIDLLNSAINYLKEFENKHDEPEP